MASGAIEKTSLTSQLIVSAFFKPVHVERFCASRNTRLLIQKVYLLKVWRCQQALKKLYKKSTNYGFNQELRRFALPASACCKQFAFMTII